MIFTKEIIQLVEKIQNSELTQTNFIELVKKLKLEINLDQNTEPEIQNLPDTYPIIDGYAKSFDVLTSSTEMLQYFNHYGFVVGRNVISNSICNSTVNRIEEITKSLDIDLTDYSTYTKDSNNVPILSRGFLEIYHDNMLAEIRQSLILYLHHVVLWNNIYLYTSFDRLGLKLPNCTDSSALPLHVDQNPKVHPNFKTIQGVIALNDCPIINGTFTVIPKSKKDFAQYLNYISPNYLGEYIELPKNSPIYKNSKIQHIPIKAGDIISWDSRTTHANGSNVSNNIRYCAYVSTGVYNPLYKSTRIEAFNSGLGSNIRNAYMHASRKPRFTDQKLIESIRQPENLNVLGKLLYGVMDYEDIL